VALVNGFALSNNQNFVVLTFASRSGDFAANNGLTQGGVTLTKNYSATALTLSTPVAAPSGFTGPQVLRSTAGDTDGDGSSDLDELRAGTNGRDPLSVLKIDALTRSGNDVQIVFSSVAGRVYTVEYSDTLAAGSWKVLVGDLLGTGESLTVFDRGAAKLERRFYRIRVSAAMGAISGFLQIELTERRTPISSPFDQPALAAGRATSVTGTSFVDENASWPAGRFVETAHGVRFRTNLGWLDLPIVSQNEKELAVSLRGANLDQFVRPGDYYEIAPLSNVAELLSGDGGVPGEVTNLALWSGRTFERIASLDASEAPTLAAAEGIMVIKKPTHLSRLWFSGQVRAGRHPSEFAVRPLDFTGTHTPLPVTLQTLRAQETPLWLSDQRLSHADRLRLWTNGRFLGYFFNGKTWQAAGSLRQTDSREIPAGSAFLIERKRK